jgi:hypothetical protein
MRRIEWVVLRSRRDPAYWAPLAAALLVVLAIGFAADRFTTRYVEELDALSALDPAAAEAAAADALRRVGALVCGAALAIAVLFARLFWLGLREARVPPSGIWSLGAHRVAVGESARRIARVGLGLAAGIAVCGIGAWLAMHRLLHVLSASPR